MTDVIAFDIDGTLTQKRIRDLFRELSTSSDLVGIVTARKANDMAEFVRRFKLQIDFEESGEPKTVSLGKMRAALRGHDRYVYVGNSRRDPVAAKASGWGFVDQRDATDVLG